MHLSRSLLYTLLWLFWTSSSHAIPTSQSTGGIYNVVYLDRKLNGRLVEKDAPVTDNQCPLPHSPALLLHCERFPESWAIAIGAAAWRAEKAGTGRLVGTRLGNDGTFHYSPNRLVLGKVHFPKPKPDKAALFARLDKVVPGGKFEYTKQIIEVIAQQAKSWKPDKDGFQIYEKMYQQMEVQI
ncbi:hypothetical protein DFH05DRAFT_1523570 [Lentinula detonsa]|uniref:Uncharacterized protein n=1 Tax=Lentinula detonsa TaxID=2804962 RepID=A0A9W8P295_9AGAR|nr:hypothetical protein DFH05DRAFT_1523570 [Lentinula detonsa]